MVKSNITVKELREELKYYRVNTKGNKQELLDRLEQVYSLIDKIYIV